MYKIHFELRGDKVYKRIILMILVIGFLSCNPASADNLFTNGDFSTGDLSGWSIGWSGGSGGLPYYWEGGCGLGVHGTNVQPGYTWINQTIDLTNVNEISFDLTNWNMEASGSYFSVSLDTKTNYIYNDNVVDGPDNVQVDVSSYSGIKDVYFIYRVNWGGWCWATGLLDNIVAEAVPPPAYITWSTWPEDSWAVGNYSMIVVGVPAPPDPVDFYIKTPSTDYIKKPLTKSPLVRTWNYIESRWYYQYFHTVYHSQYGDYSCKIVNSSEDFIEYSNITVPYSSPDVPIPPVVTIPTPDPIETPPEWNVTIPEQYENVSWIFDYTDFWDELGITLNDTLYSTVGLIFIPMESINESVYTVYTHVDTAADMVSGSEHTNVIVQVAWNVIPDSIKTVFIGAAAIGLCIFILHRRT